MIKRLLSSSCQNLKLDKSQYRPLIGLEVHVQLKTRTKLFSRSGNRDGPPNRLVSAFDMATPGVLPALNNECIHQAIKIGLLMKCDFLERSKFERKHYYYADMPAGYQITQNERPYARKGVFGFHVFRENMDTYWKEVKIHQLQLEQDSGKTIHMDHESLIDYNRAGCALVEVVTTPCFSTAIEAVCFVQHLRLLLMHHGVCGGELHKGHLRVDANVSLSYDSDMGVRTEIKNMNSIRCIHTAINFEIARQFEIISNNGTVLNETRAADSEGRTVSMRDKEQETDYRFMSEPNLPLLTIHQNRIDKAEFDIRNRGKATFEILRDDIGFEPKSAIHIAEDTALLKFVEACLRYKDDSVSAANILTWMKELKTIMQRCKANYPPLSDFFASQFMSLISMFNQEKLTRLRMMDLLRVYATSDETIPARKLIEDNKYFRINDISVIEKTIENILQQNIQTVEKARNDHAKSFTKLRNLVINGTNKCVEVEDVERILKDVIKRFNKTE